MCFRNMTSGSAVTMSEQVGDQAGRDREFATPLHAHGHVAMTLTNRT